MTNEVKKEETVIECDHIGHWTAGGMVPINAPNGAGLFLAQVIFCNRCGKNHVQLHSITSQQPTVPKEPEITKP